MNTKNTRIAGYLAFILLILVALLLSLESATEKNQLYFIAQTEETSEYIQIWQNDDENYFVFLPSYLKLSNLQLHTDNTIWFDELKMRNGTTCEDIQLRHPYVLSDGTNKTNSITFIQSKNIPTVYIDTLSGNMDFIHKRKGNQESGNIRIYTAEGALNYSGRLDSINARGNSTFFFSKKPYSLQLTSDGNLLSMGYAKKWILLANAYDSTHLKNKLVFDFASEVGLTFSPECQWVDLFLNGEYVGLYLLTEKNEIHPQRVDIKKENSFLVSKYLLDDFKTMQVPYVVTNNNVALRIHQSSLKKETIQQIFQSAENAILAENGIDRITGKHWTELIDIDSWVRKYLIEEIFGGTDAGISSQYFFYQRDQTFGKIIAGPVWDFDDTMGMPIWTGFNEVQQIPEIFYAHRKYETPWFHSLYNNDTFYTRLQELYREQFSSLLTTYIEEKLPEYTALIFDSAKMNQIRWNTGDMLKSADYTQQFMRKRIEFLNRIWIENQDYITVSVDFSKYEAGTPYLEIAYNLSPGSCMPELPTAEDYSWFYAETDIPFDFSQPLYQDTSICLEYAERPVESPTAPRQSAKEKIANLIKIGSIGLILIMFLVILTVDILRSKRSNQAIHDRTNKHKISSRTEI